MGKPVKIDTWKNAVRIVCDALNTIKKDAKTANYEFAVIGSGAYVVHGVEFKDPMLNPGDIDITTTNPLATRQAIMALADTADIKVVELPNSSIVVNHFMLTFKTGEEVELDLTHANDFGFGTAGVVEKDGMRVTSLMDTLQSIALSLHRRADHRTKDMIAFKELIRKNPEELSLALKSEKFDKPEFDNLKKAVTYMMEIFSDPEKSNNEELIHTTMNKLFPEIITPQHEEVGKKASRAFSDHSLFAHHQAPAKSSSAPVDLKSDERRQRALEKRQRQNQKK